VVTNYRALLLCAGGVVVWVGGVYDCVVVLWCCGVVVLWGGRVVVLCFGGWRVFGWLLSVVLFGVG